MQIIDITPERPSVMRKCQFPKTQGQQGSLWVMAHGVLDPIVA